MTTVHEVLTRMLEDWSDRPIEDVDEFLLVYEQRIHDAYHSLWFNGIQEGRNLYDY